MPRSNGSKRLSSFQMLHHGWMNLQVELHGKYSRQRLGRLHAYGSQRSWLGIAGICLVTPLPCLLLLTLVDCVPLRAPSDGAFANDVFWVRNAITTTSIMLAITDQLRTFLPRFPLSTRVHVGIALLASMTGVGQMFGFSLAIGFPVPFSGVLATPGVGVVLVGSLVWVWRDVLRANPSWWRDLIKYAAVFGTQVSLTVIYPAYVYVFNQLSGQRQALFALVLPMIKIATKNIISRCLRGHDDLKPQGIILNVEIFNSLYVSMCMQNSTSRVTIVVLMAVDFVQAWISLHDMSAWITDVQTLVAKLPPAPTGSRQSLVDVAVSILEAPSGGAQSPSPSPLQSLPTHSVSHSPGVWGTGRMVRMASTAVVHPATIINDATGHAGHSKLAKTVVHVEDAGIRGPQGVLFQTLEPSERVQLIELTKKILFATEFLILVEYTEVIIPITYCAVMVQRVYTSTMFYLPNRAFYPHLQRLDAPRLQQMIRAVGMYSSLELASFVTMLLILRYRLRISGLHQLAFVLDKQWRFVQANLLVWMMYIVQSTLVHYGADFSMKFAWLKQPLGP